MRANASVALLTATALMLTASCAFADAAVEIACFTSETATPVRFEMRTYFDRDIKFSFALIKYTNAKAAIPVVLQSDAAESRDGGRADEVTTTWLEVAGGAVRGSYKMVHQGANVDSMTYTNFKTKKTVLFLLDTHVDSTLEQGCAWER